MNNPSPNLRTLLLFPRHLSLTTVPLLRHIQSFINTSYAHTYGSRPDLFAPPVLRLPDAATFKELIRDGGFTVAIFADVSEGEGKGELVATGSVRIFTAEDVQRYVGWAEWRRRARNDGARNETDSDDVPADIEELNRRLPARFREWQHAPRVYEGCMFAVSPPYRRFGLSSRMIDIFHWLIGHEGAEMLEAARSGGDASGSLGVEACLSWMGEKVRGVDCDELKRVFEHRGAAKVVAAGGKTSKAGRVDAKAESSGPLPWVKLVGVAVDGIGTIKMLEAKGHRVVGTGVLPVGAWGNTGECPVVFTEIEFR